MLYMEPPRTERHVVVPRKPHRWRVAFVLGMCAAVLFLGAEAKAQAPPPSESVSHAKVSLVAENASPPLGKPLWVGLLFQLDPGWHIYWQNPGDSGEPPKVQWLLPRGFRASFFDWPAPIRLGSGSVIDYGYEGQVLLMAPITSTGTRESERHRSDRSRCEVCGVQRNLHPGQGTPHALASRHRKDCVANRGLARIVSADQGPTAEARPFRREGGRLGQGSFCACRSWCPTAAKRHLFPSAAGHDRELGTAGSRTRGRWISPDAQEIGPVHVISAA